MSNKPRVLVTRRLPPAVEARLTRDYDAVLTDRAYSADTLIATARETAPDAMLATAIDPLPANVIEALPESVRIIATFAVGTDNIDLAAARARGLIVANTPDVLTDACADLAMMLILTAARRAHEGNQLVRTGAWQGWRPDLLLGRDLKRKRLGILGMGRIGRALAKRARAFGMEIHYSNRRRLDRVLEGRAIYHAEPEELLRASHVLSLNAPGSAETRGFLNAERIALLPDGAIVVNIARGDMIDDEALIAALKSGKLAAAGLDVFAGEPNIHPGYRDLPNLFAMPHAGSSTIETRDRMGFANLDSLDAYFAGRAVPARVV